MAEFPLYLEILDWVFLVAALVCIVLQYRIPDRTSAQYRGLNVASWVFLAACFGINGIESASWFRWLWFVAAVASLIMAFVPPRSARVGN